MIIKNILKYIDLFDLITDIFIYNNIKNSQVRYCVFYK